MPHTIRRNRLFPKRKANATMAALIDQPTYTLEPHGVDIWLCYENQIDDASLLRCYEGLLSEDERQKRSRFYFAEDRHRYLVTRAMVRSVLSLYRPSQEQDWFFSTNEYGKPFISSESLQFNISHTKGLIVMAVSEDFELGIDVEHEARKNTGAEIADRFFSPIEIEQLRQTDPDAFLDFWTLKEAYIKAQGKGLALPLDSFSFVLDQQQIRFQSPAIADVDAWRFYLWRVKQFKLALAFKASIDHESIRYRLRTIIPQCTIADETLELQASV